MLTTLAGTNQPARVISAGDGPGVLVNRDETNQVFISPNAGFNATDVTASILDPLVGIPFDGQEDIYACVAGGVSVTVDYILGAQNWEPSPAQAAAQINALGLATSALQTTQQNTLVSGIGLPVNAAKEAGGILSTGIARPIGAAATTDVITTLPANLGGPNGVGLNHTWNELFNASFLVAPNNVPTNLFPAITLTKPGYFGFITVQCASAASTSPITELIMNWLDASGRLINQDHWFLCGFSGAAMQYTIEGPQKAAALVMTAVNFDTVGNSTLQITYGETTHHIARDDWRCLTQTSAGNIPISPSPVTGITGDPASLQLASGASPLLAANGSALIALPLYCGQIQVSLENNASASWAWGLNPIGQNNRPIATEKVSAVGFFQTPQLFNLGRLPYALSLSNGAGQPNDTWAITIVGVEYAS